ncbi:MAG: trigger factor [bacterium]
MKTSSNRIEDFRVELTVVIPADEIEKKFNENMSEAIKDLNLPGFRKGKAPKNLLEQQISREKLWDITRKDIIDDTLTEATEKENLRILSTEDVNQDDHTPGEDFTYRARFRLMPEIPDFEYKGIPVKVEKIDITDKEIDLSIENLRINWAESNPITDRPAQEGDWALIVLEGKELKRIFLPGESGAKKKMFPISQLSVEIGRQRGIVWLDKEIVGMKVKEKKTAHITMPKDFINPPLDEDAEIEAKIELQWLEEKILPEITDDYLVEKKIAKDIGELRKKIREDLESQAKAFEDEQVVQKIHDWLVENVEFVLPDDIIESKKNEITERLRQEYHQRGQDLEMILKRVDDQAIKIREEIRKQSVELARLDFLVPHIAEKEELTVSQPELLNYIQMIAQQTQLKKHQIKKLMEDTDFLMHTYRSILSRKVTTFLLNHAAREYIEVDSESDDKEKDSGSLIVSG